LFPECFAPKSVPFVFDLLPVKTNLQHKKKQEAKALKIVVLQN